MKRRGVYGRRNIGQIRRATMLSNGAGQKNEATENVKNKTSEKKTAERSE